MRRRAVMIGFCLLALSGCSSSGSGSDGTLPGGTAGKDILTEHGFLVGGGKLIMGETIPKDQTTQHAFCDYLFGTPDEIADAAKLAGDVTITDDSGAFSLGGNGSGYLCRYQADGKDAFQVGLSTNKDVDLSKAKAAVKVDVSDTYLAVLGYAPTYSGDTIDTASAKQWLTEAGSRTSS